MSQNVRKVRDFKNGMNIAGCTLLAGIILGFIVGYISTTVFLSPLGIFTAHFIILVSLPLSVIGFKINYTPLKVTDTHLIIPAVDQIRTFTDLIILNNISGYFRTRKFHVDDIEEVSNGYTKPGPENIAKVWNVVLVGMKNNQSFSQSINVSTKQQRDEVRNVLKRSIKGRVNSDFSI